MENIYLIVEHFNDYDQHGGVPISAHKTRESAEKSVHHIGRKDFEYSWYEIEEFELNGELT